MNYEWYIETTDDGNIVNHPARAENLMQVWGHIPEHWVPFQRVGRPELGPYEFFSRPDSDYVYVNGIWTEEYAISQCSNEDKIKKQNTVKEWWNSRPRPNLTAWTFNEETCQYEAPIPMPTDGQNYFWQGITNTWQIKPPYPMDGKNYTFDFANAIWVE